jgi:RNA polymerase sigma-70 factor (ECF subfamily)
MSAQPGTATADVETERSFERLYRLHRKDVFSLVLRDLGDPDDAEDVTQVTFLNAYRALMHGVHPEAPRAWLYAIARNLVKRRFRTLARRPREVQMTVELLDEAERDAGPSAAEIQAALDDMPPRQRSALVLRELGGLPYAEIATRLEISVPAVETLLFRARAGFRERLERTRAFAVTGLPAGLLGRLSGWLGSVSDPTVVGRVVGVVGALAIGTGIALETGTLPGADAARGHSERRPAAVATPHYSLPLARREHASGTRASARVANDKAASPAKKHAAGGDKTAGPSGTSAATSGSGDNAGGGATDALPLPSTGSVAPSTGSVAPSTGSVVPSTGSVVPSTGSVDPSGVPDATSQVSVPDTSSVTATVSNTVDTVVSTATGVVPSVP